MLKKFRIKINEKEYIVEMEDLNPEVQFQTTSPQEMSQPTIPVESTAVSKDTPATQKPESSTPSRQLGAGEEVTAPMPGTILDIHVKEGDTVTEEQAILVLEAMKMENQIVSPVNGTITSILVQKGQAVDVGEVLFTVG